MTPKRRFGRTDWLTLGLNVIAREGPRGLTLEKLCQKARRTRGSFYHHFRNHQAYLDALVDEWRRTSVQELIIQSRQGSSQERLERLNQLASQLSPHLELGFRRLASTNSKVRRKIKSVDEERMKYLAGIYRAAGLEAANAADVARLEYATYVGAQTLWPHATPAETEELGNFLGGLVARYLRAPTN